MQTRLCGGDVQGDALLRRQWLLSRECGRLWGVATTGRTPCSAPASVDSHRGQSHEREEEFDVASLLILHMRQREVLLHGQERDRGVTKGFTNVSFLPSSFPFTSSSFLSISESTCRALLRTHLSVTPTSRLNEPCAFFDRPVLRILRMVNVTSHSVS